MIRLVLTVLLLLVLVSPVAAVPITYTILLHQTLEERTQGLFDDIRTALTKTDMTWVGTFTVDSALLGSGLIDYLDLLDFTLIVRDFDAAVGTPTPNPVAHTAQFYLDGDAPSIVGSITDQTIAWSVAAFESSPLMPFDPYPDLESDLTTVGPGQFVVGISDHGIRIFLAGTYRIERVPLPPTLLLVALALSAGAVRRWRRQ